MTKKKGSRPPSRTGSEYDEDDAKSFSTASQKSFGGRNGSSGWEAELEEIEDDPFHENVEKLYEKRTSTREEGLAGLISLLTSQWQYEEAVFRQETFSQMFLGSLKRGGPKESELAARALGLHVITLGASDASERIFKEALPTLEPIILTGKAVASRLAAIDALSMLCFVGSEGAHETLPVMALFSKAYSRGVPKVQAAALRGWSLLLTTVQAGQLSADFVETQIKALAALLHSDDVEVRSGAGEAVALLYDSCGLAELPESPIDTSGMAAAAAALASPARAAYGAGRPPLPPSAAHRNGGSASPVVTPGRALSPAASGLAQLASPEREGGPAVAAAAAASRDAGAAPQQQEQQEEGHANGSVTVAAIHGMAMPPPQQPSADVAEARQPDASPDLQQPHQQHQEPEEQEEEEFGEDEIAGGLDLGHEGGAPAAAVTPLAATTQARAAPPQQLLSDSDEEQGGDGAGVPVKRLEDIVSRMKDLAKNRGDASRRSRKERASQRGTFRELCNIVEAGSVSSQKIKLRHGDMLVVDALPATVRLNAMRRFLAEGFQAHMQDNTLLHQVFNFQPLSERPEKLSAWEKRMYRSPASAESKARTQQRKKDRATMAAYKGSLLGGGHE